MRIRPHVRPYARPHARSRVRPPLLLAAAVAAVLALSGCSDGASRPAGTVTAKETDQECGSSKSGKKKRHRSCHTEYELTVRTKKGKEVEFDVSRSDYEDCAQGSAYPKCTKSKN